MPLDWNSVQDRIYSLYVAQQLPLPKVEALMKAKYGFSASTRSYKSKIKVWGYRRKRGARRSLSHVGSQQDRSQVSSEITNISQVLHPPVGMSNAMSDLEAFSLLATTESPLGNLVGWDLSESARNMFQSSLGTQKAAYMRLHTSNGPILFDIGDLSSIRQVWDQWGPNMEEDNDRTSLHRAAILGSLQDVERCLNLGAVVDMIDDEGDQALHYAAAGGFHQIVSLLLRSGAKVDAKTRVGRTPLHVCLSSHKTVKALLNENATVSIQDDNGDTPLHLALAASLFNEPPESSVIRTLINSGANVNMRNNSDITPFHMVLQKSCPAGVHRESYVVMFLENGADIFLQTEDGRLPFQVFVDETPNLWGRYEGTIPYAQRHRDLKLFIAKGANVDIILKSGELLIIDAFNGASVWFGNDEVVKLICHTANINKAGADGLCPLHYLLCRRPYYFYRLDDVKSWILKHGVNPNLVNGDGYSPLIVHIMHGNGTADIHVTKALLDAGADQMQRDAAGELPVYFAIRMKKDEEKKELVKTLLNFSSWKEKPNRTLSTAGSEPKDQRWWKLYEFLYFHSSRLSLIALTDLRHLLPADVAEYLLHAALAVLVERFVERVAAELKAIKTDVPYQQSGISIKHLRVDLVEVLRDCPRLKIEVDPAWLGLLLDLQD